MANLKLPDTFNEIDFTKDYLSNMKPKELAVKYGMSEPQVYNYIARQDLTKKKEKLKIKIEASIENNIQAKIKTNTDLVVDRLIKIVNNSNNESNVIKACESILSISGLKKQTLDNNVKTYKELPEMPTEIIMLRDRKKA